MSWLKNKLRRWLNSDDSVCIPEDRPYATAANSMGDASLSVQMFKAMNGSVLVLYPPPSATKHLINQNKPSIYILKEGENIQDAVATLLVKARLDSM